MNSEQPVLIGKVLRSLCIETEVVQREDGTFELYCKAENSSGGEALHLKTADDIGLAFASYIKSQCFE